MHESVHCEPQKKAEYLRELHRKFLNALTSFRFGMVFFFSRCVPMFVSSFGVMTGAMRNSYIRMLFVCV